MERFFEKVEKTKSCWIWKAGMRSKEGYGAFKLKGKVIDAHRVSFTIHYGEIPKGMFICHTCDNRKCVNPKHLFLGTHSDNMKDAYNKGKLNIPITSRFKQNHLPKNSSLKNKEEILFIKKELKNRTISLKELAKKLNVSYQMLRDINSGRTYKIY